MDGSGTSDPKSAVAMKIPREPSVKDAWKAIRLPSAPKRPRDSSLKLFPSSRSDIDDIGQGPAEI